MNGVVEEEVEEEDEDNAYRLLVGKPEGKRPLGRPRRRWVDNISAQLHIVSWFGYRITFHHFFFKCSFPIMSISDAILCGLIGFRVIFCLHL
jgi:hypothetical protein